MGVFPLAPTLGTGLKGLLHADMAFTPAYGAGQIASGLLLSRSPAVGTFNGRGLDRNITAAAANRAPRSLWFFPFARAKSAIKLIAVA